MYDLPPRFALSGREGVRSWTIPLGQSALCGGGGGQTLQKPMVFSSFFLLNLDLHFAGGGGLPYIPCSEGAYYRSAALVAALRPLGGVDSSNRRLQQCATIADTALGPTTED